MVGFISASLFPARKRQGVIQGGYTTQRGRESREPVSANSGRTSETAGALKIHSRKTMTRARAPLPPTIEPRLPPPHIYIFFFHFIYLIYLFITTIIKEFPL